MSKINSSGLLNALIGIVNTNDEDESKLVMAKYFLKNFDRLHEINIFDAAEECFVTRASIRRFAKSLGFDNFKNLKTDVKEYGYYSEFMDEENYSDLLVQRITQMAIDCNGCLKDQLTTILDYIDSSEQVIFLASDIYGSRCTEFQKSMILAGKMVRVVSHNFTENKLLENLNEDTLLITISISGGFAADVNDFVKEFRCKKLFFTTVDNPMFTDNYDLVLQLSSDSLSQTKTVYHTFAVEYCLDVIYNGYRRRMT